MLIVSIFVYFLSRYINNSFTNLSNGVQGFFDYLNRKSQNVQMLDDSKNDEISHVAKIINENITISKKGIENNRNTINEIITTLEILAKGDLSQRINIEV